MTGQLPANTQLRAAALPPEENIQKNHHLRPLRLRRSSPARHALSSGEHSLTGVNFAGAVYLMVIDALIGAGSFLR